jgi:SAM-dependent methyltransferase
VELIAGDVARMDPAALGLFDFIIAHGMYSWVPENVQDAILSAFRRLLAPEGVAYVSHNVYPGWKAKETMRDAMLLAGGALARVGAEFKARDEGFGDSYLLHDELETFNPAR